MRLCTILATILPVLIVLAQKGDRSRSRCSKTVDISEEVTSPPVTSANRGHPIDCWYRFKNKTMGKDWIISVRFFRFKVGRLVNATTCLEAYVQIIDGKDGSETSNKDLPGFFCGESDHSHTFISETNHVKIFFHADKYTEDTFFSFDTRAEQQFQLYARYGNNPQLYPARRGRVVAGSYCDRVFDDCRLRTCYIQSPGYPGVYARGLHCMYRVRTDSAYIRLHTEKELVDIGGQRCEDRIVCPVRPVSTVCPHDQVRIYDGVSESSGLIGEFCGRGKFPFSITGSGRDLLIVFISSLAGPFLSTGFNFKVGPSSNWVGHGARLNNGSCDAVFHSEDELKDEDRRFHSLSTWYPPHTRCGFTILGRDSEVIRLRFKKFKAGPQSHAIGVPDQGECAETLTIYDSHTRDDSKLLATFCDSTSATNSQSSNSKVISPEGGDFVSTSNAMFVLFSSASGSYFGSAIDYWAQFDFFNAFRYGTHVARTRCDEEFTSSRGASGGGSTGGPFSSPLNSLVFHTRQPVTCRYTFEDSMDPLSRILLTFISVHFATSTHQQCISCIDDPVDKIIVSDSYHTEGNGTIASVGGGGVYCLCGATVPPPGTRTPVIATFLSAGPRLDVTLGVSSESTEYYFSKAEESIFKGEYEFVHGAACGPPVLQVQNQGELLFPYHAGYRYSDSSTPVEDGEASAQNHFPYSFYPQSPASTSSSKSYASQSNTPMRCIWTILVSMRKDVYLRFENLRLHRNCSLERIEVRIPSKKHEYARDVQSVVCGSSDHYGQTTLDLAVIRSTSLTSNRIIVEFRSTSSPNGFADDADKDKMAAGQAGFKLVWTELSQLEHQSRFTMNDMAVAASSTDCSFVCEGSNTCIPQDLVCNGVRNCPSSSTTFDPAASNDASDEAHHLCQREETRVNWVAISLGAAGGAVLSLSFIFVIHRCCKRCHDTDPG